MAIDYELLKPILVQSDQWCASTMDGKGRFPTEDENGAYSYAVDIPVSYTHLTLPTIYSV